MMFEMNVRWKCPLDERVTCPPVTLRDLTIIRQSNLLRAFDEEGREVWSREITSGPEDGELAANDEVIVTSFTIEITDGNGALVASETRFDLFDEGAERVGTLTAHGTMRHRGLVVRNDALHAWMNDGGIALRRAHLDRPEDELAEVFVPYAQPWDANVTRRGVVLIGFTGRREGACLWDPRTQSMAALVEDVDVWSHGITDEIAVFAIGPNEVETTLVAVDLTTREEIWRREDTTRGIAVCELGVLVYLGAQDRIPALLDLTTGDILWMATTTHRGFEWQIVGPIAMSCGRETVAYDLETGRHLGQGTLTGMVAFDDHFVGVADDAIVAFEYPTALAEDSQPSIVVEAPRGLRRARINTPMTEDRWELPARTA